MSNEYGEDPSFYIWPKGQEDGEPFGDDFHERLSRALATEGLDWESV